MSSIHVWAPDLFATGGIQRFSRHFIEAVTAVMPSEELSVFLKNDLPRVFRGRSEHYLKTFGHWPASVKTAAFSAECLWSCWRDRPRLIASMHLNFGPLARLANALTGV